jgi:Domain of Unknown Function (DUF1206)
VATVDRGEEALRRKADKTRAKAETGSGWYAVLARVGLVAKGISFGLVGGLAIGVAVGHGGKTTSRNGALATIADEWWGKGLLALLALGFAAYAIWRFVEAFAEREADEDEAKGEAKKWAKRAGYVGRGLIYAGLTYTAVRLLVGSGGGESQNQKAQKTTAEVFDWPAGRWIVGLVGLCIVGAGVWNVYRGLTRKFEDRWRGGMSRTERIWGSRAGLVGHVARGIVFGLVGIFITKAAIDYNPHDAIGLDGALQKLARASYGPWLLGLTAAGLIAYGLFCLVDARYRDVSAGP